MNLKSNYKIKKSKLLFRLPVQSKFSYDDLQAKQKKVCQMTYQSIRHSTSKFKTVNYKEYDQQRKNQIQKRKLTQKPLSLYLDGGNPLTQPTNPQILNKTSQKNNYFNRLQKLSQNLTPHDHFNNNNFISSKKSLKQMILKQIQLKNKTKDQNHKFIPKNNLSFQTVEELFVFKKLKNSNKEKKFELSNKKKLTLITNLKNNSFAYSQIKPPNASPKFSILSERNTSSRKDKLTFNPEHQFSQILLPSVQDKAISRPLIFLEGNDAKKIQTESYLILKHQQKKIICGINYKKTSQIASLTKIMTFYTILSICREYAIDYAKRVIEICQRAEEMTGTSAEIFTEQKYTLEQLFYGMMLPSGNDAAVAIANEGGLILKMNKSKKINCEEQNVKCFIKYMNILAKNIGMHSSTFSNPHGLSNPHNYSNAYEMSLLISQCLHFQEFLKVTGTKSYSFWTEGQKNKRQISWQNTHKLLRRPGFIGGKTGVTVTAGPCLTTVYKTKSNQTFIVIVLRASKLSRRFKQTRLILGLSFKKLDAKKYEDEVKQILKSNPDLDSDNSQDEETFDFKKSDSTQMRKRNKILVYEM